MRSNRRRRLRKRRLLVLPLSRLFPNMVTMAGLCCGLSSIRFAMEGKFEAAVAMIVAAAVIDGMDGRIARFLNATSTFGAQLDSLSDFLCFGVAPVLVAYKWQLQEVGSIGWAVVLFYAVCCALRLARFNTNLIEDEDTTQTWRAKFFVGIPSPAGAMLCLMPIVASFYAPAFLGHPFLDAVWVALVGALMASRVPTFALKKIKIHHEWVLPIMFIFCICIVIILVEPWIMFTLVGFVYCLTIPFSVIRHRKLAAVHSGTAIPTVSSLPE
jgi:CDP-diacylglycerol---serine O-phosphatidyltransferase